MPLSPYWFAYLCKQTYQDPDSQQVNYGYTLPNGYEIFALSGNGPSIIPHIDWGYYGFAVRKIGTNELTIFHRGTDITNPDALSSYINAIRDNTPQQYEYGASIFTEQVQEQFLSQVGIPPALLHVGHSQGGLLAQLCSLKDRVQGVGFDSPGVQEIVEENDLGFALPNNANQLLTLYQVAPNLINTANTHIAKIIRLYPSYSPSSLGGASVLGYATFTIQQHAIAGIFPQFDIITGQPKVYSNVDTWPLGGTGLNSGYDVFFKNYNNNPEYWDEYCVTQDILGQDKIDFISNELGGVTSLGGEGITITADSTASSVWGATTKKDTINSYGGSPVLAGFEGEDSYNIFADSKGNLGKPTIYDRGSDGLLHINGHPLTGTAQPVTNRPEGTTFTLKAEDNSLYILTRINDGGVVDIVNENCPVFLQKSA